MSANLPTKKPVGKIEKKWVALFVYPLWIVVAFIFTQFLLAGVVIGSVRIPGVLALLNTAGVPLSDMSQNVLMVIVSVLIYGLTLATVLGVPVWAKKQKISLAQLGLQRLPSWGDIAIAPFALIPWFLLSALFLYTATLLFPALDLNQAQDVGFTLKNTMQDQLILAFIGLVVLAPLAEETLFRGYLYGKLRAHFGMVPTTLVVSLLFAAVHWQWNVGIDVFALSLVLCALRETTDSIWAGVLVHMLKNGIAFYMLALAPSLIH